MSPLLTAFCCGAAIFVLLLLVRRFGVRHWIWQALSLTLAVAVGLLPLMPHWSEPGWILLIGCAFVLLGLWAVSETVETLLRHFPGRLRRH